jgi:hypothetical protein
MTVKSFIGLAPGVKIMALFSLFLNLLTNKLECLSMTKLLNQTGESEDKTIGVSTSAFTAESHVWNTYRIAQLYIKLY